MVAIEICERLQGLTRLTVYVLKGMLEDGAVIMAITNRAQITALILHPIALFAQRFTLMLTQQNPRTTSAALIPVIAYATSGPGAPGIAIAEAHTPYCNT